MPDKYKLTLPADILALPAPPETNWKQLRRDYYARQRQTRTKWQKLSAWLKGLFRRGQ